MPLAPDLRLIDALRKVAEFGDVAPPQVRDPMTILLRQKIIMANFVRWDEDQGQFVLTVTGRSRISNSERAAATILPFKSRCG